VRLVYDTESDGFVEQATRIWCIVLKDTYSGVVYQFDDSTRFKSIQHGIQILEDADEIIAHNQIDHDLRLIKKLYPKFCPSGKILDTMLLSQLLQPDRAGGHSLRAAGERQGRPKPEHEDWSQYSPEMLHRCSEDVEINHVLLDELQDEAYDEVHGIPYEDIFK